MNSIRLMHAVWGLALILLVSPAVHGREVPGVRGVDDPALHALRLADRPAARLADRIGIEPLAALPAARVAEPEKLDALIEYNLAGNLPMQVGFERGLPAPRSVVLTGALPGRPQPGAHAGGVIDVVNGERLVWTARIDIANAHGIRVLLSDVSLPAGTRVWTYAADGPVRGPVGAAQTSGGRLWTPAVFAATVYVEIDVPLAALAAGARAEFRIERVAEIFRLDARGVPLSDPQPQTHGGCLVDGMCKGPGELSFIEDYRRSVANLIFPVGTQFFTCTGGLLNTAVGPEPLLLTASHCISTPASAAGLDAFWDHVTDECDGTDPGIGSFPSTSGSTLLATSSSTDFTLVEITDSLPANRYHLGWNTDAQPHGTTLHRLHHPGVTAQHYSRGMADLTGPIECGSIPRPRYLYSQLEEGTELGGSSGSVVVIDAAGGQVVGQLFGVCGTNINDECDYVNNRTVDGAFAFTHFATREWLDPTLAAENDAEFPLAGFTLGGNQSTTRNFTCSPGDAGDVIAFSFRGTASGLMGQSWASDLRLQLAGPSGSSFDVGGFPNPVNDWPYQGSDSIDDGAYRASFISVFNSNGDGTTACLGNWTATFRNAWAGSGPVTWSDVSIILHKIEVEGCPFEDHLVLSGHTVTGNETFEACITITVGPDFTVGASGEVTFRAGERVILGEGFTVEPGGKVNTEIVPM